MAVSLGKRKRPESRHVKAPTSDSSSSDDADYQEIFRRAFEKKFRPLDVPQKKKQEKPEEAIPSSDEGASDWEGLESDAEGEEHDGVEVVEHKHAGRTGELSKAEMRAFMVRVCGLDRKVLRSHLTQQAKPPTSSIASTSAPPSKTETADDGDEKLNLKHDLALQRLINESHLLDPSKQAQSTHKQKVLDMRLQSLGAKGSHVKQEKMPLSHRKGMVAKAAEREEKRRREAKENGVVLERAKKPRKAESEVKRVRGVGGPGVGKFRNGMLSLSKRDVASITGRRPEKPGGKKRR